MGALEKGVLEPPYELCIVSSIPFCLAEADLQKILPEVLSGALGWVKTHRFNAFSRNLNTISWKIYPSHVGIYKSEKYDKHSGEIKP